MKRNEAGFTLIELVVTMLVVTIVAIGLSSFAVSWLQISSSTQARANLLSNAENALDTINTDVRLSGDADANNRWSDPNAPGAPTNELSWQSDSQTLVLAKVATDSTGNIIFSDPAKYISQKDNEIYYLSGTTLYRRTLASNSPNDAAVTTCPPASATASCPADKTIATGVSNFSVQYYDANENVVTPTSARSIQLAITLSSSQGGQTITASYNTRMVFRNK